MKKQVLAGALLGLTLLCAGCGSQKSAETTAPAETVPGNAVSVTIEFSNLSSREDQEELRQLLDTVDISRERQDAFFAHVDQINSIMTPDQLTQGYEIQDSLSPGYDPYQLQDAWDQAYPGFMGYNCRITAFSLFGDHVTVAGNALAREEPLLFDLDSLAVDPSAFPGREHDFAALYSAVPTNGSTDPMDHLHAVQADWEARGISFHDDPDIRLISVVFHDMLDPNHPQLTIGHAGVLFPISTRELYFVEKLAFQEPYQCLKFTDRRALNDYLMGKYDVEFNQPVSAPFIMENNELMEGYRSLR